MDKKSLFRQYVSQLGMKSELLEAVCKLHEACFESEAGVEKKHESFDEELPNDSWTKLADLTDMSFRNKIGSRVKPASANVAKLSEEQLSAVTGLGRLANDGEYDTMEKLIKSKQDEEAKKKTEAKKQEVIKLQKKLVSAGYKVDVDGIYGPQTRKAHEQYKKYGPVNTIVADKQPNVMDRKSDQIGDRNAAEAAQEKKAREAEFVAASNTSEQSKPQDTQVAKAKIPGNISNVIPRG